MSRSVLIFRDTLLPPSETFVLTQAEKLTRFRPVFCGLMDAPRSLPVPNPILLTKQSVPFAHLRFTAYRRYGVQLHFHRRVREAGADLIHAHFAIDATNALGLQAYLGLPMVVTLHGYDVMTDDTSFARSKSGRRFLSRRPLLWDKAAKFICVSHAIRDRALHLGFPEHKLVVRYIGIDCEMFTPTPSLQRDPNLILFVGRLVEKKGCEYLLRAAAQVKNSYKDLKVVIVGDGPLRAELERLAEELRAPATFVGVQTPAQVREWMARARVLCNPSVTAANGDGEGLGMVFAEAQASGLPVVSTRHTAVPEVVRHGETGLLANERDVDQLREHLMRMLGDHEFWVNCSERGISWIRETFDIRKCTAGLEDTYEEALSRV